MWKFLRRLLEAYRSTRVDLSEELSWHMNRVRAAEQHLEHCVREMVKAAERHMLGGNDDVSQ